VTPRLDKKPEGKIDVMDDLPPFAQSEPLLEVALSRIGQPNVGALIAVTLLDASHTIEEADDTCSYDTTPDRHQGHPGITETDETAAVRKRVGRAGRPRRIEEFDHG
jgi:hypothetical protein